MRVPALLLLVLAALLLPAQAHAQWGPREAAPEGIGDATQPHQLPDGSWVWLADGPRVNNVQKVKWLQRDAAGATTARDLPGSYGGDSFSAPTIDLSAPDSAGTAFTFKSGSPYGTLRFPFGVDPSTPTLQSTPSNVGALDVAPSGEAAALIDGGNDLGVIFRPAGADAVWDAKRTLNRGGAQRAYDIGITLDPDGGVFVVYETQQPASVLTAYAPPGGSFGTPVPVPAADADYVRYAQSTNGHGIVAWENPPASGTTNPQLVYAATRAPGGGIGAPALLLDRSNRGQYHSAGADSAGITDDGSAYVGLSDGPTLSPCSNNGDNGLTAQLARGHAGSAEWTLETIGGGDWPERAYPQQITTSGNRVGVLLNATTDKGARCANPDPGSQLRFTVALGTGSTLGAFTTLYDRQEVPYQYTSAQGLGIGAGGGALLLVKEIQPAARLFAYPYTGSPVPDPAPEPPGPATPGTPGTPTTPGTTTTPGGQKPPVTPPLPAPGGVTFPAGFTVVDKNGTVTFKAGCAAESRDGIDICKVRAGFREAIRTTRPRAAAKAKSLGAVSTSVKAGRSKTITVKLNQRGRRLAKRKGGVKVTFTATITRGAAVKTVTKKATLKTGRR